MKILFLTEQFPYPLHDGGNLRTYHVLKGLCAHHHVTMVAHAARENPDRAVRSVSGFCEVYSVPEPYVARRVASNLLQHGHRPPLFVIKNASNAILKTADRLIAEREFDAVHLNMLDTAFFALHRDWDVPLVFDSHNCLAQIAEGASKNAGDPIRRAVYRRETRLLRECESQVAARADLTLVCSANDALLFEELAPRARCMVAPNGVDSNFFVPASVEYTDDHESHCLVFTGSMSYFPNEEASLWFARQVMPLLQRVDPNIRIDLVGRTPPASVRSLHDGRSIHVTGTVPDVRPFVQQADVFVVPLQTGGGTRLKILEAFSMGKAVVSTSKGAEGIPAENGKQILIADQPQEFADAVLDLLRSPERREQLGVAARALVKEQFDWKVVQELVLDGYQSLGASEATSGDHARLNSHDCG